MTRQSGDSGDLPATSDLLADALAPDTVAKRGSPSYVPFSSKVADHIREAILDGEYAPGAPLRQEALAKELEVSRVPVREALRQLESEGLVVLRPHSGARVAMLALEECIELYKMRERLEPLAFGESIGRLSDEQLQVVRETCDELEGVDPDPRGWLRADRRFHLACYAGVPTPRLPAIVAGLWSATQQYRRVLLSTFTPHDFHTAQQEHRLMVDALENDLRRAGETLVRTAIERSRLRLTQHPELFHR